MFIRIYHVKKRSKYNILETANRDFLNSRFVKKELIDMADIVDLLAEHICE